MKNNYKFFTLLLIFISSISLNLYAESSQSVLELEHGTNKLNVVIGVILIIFIGIVMYLVNMDKKLKKLRDDISSKK